MDDTSKEAALRDLRRIPGVGVSIARDLWDLEIHAVAQLDGANAEDLYERLCVLRGARIDRCMLYVMRCAVYFASPGPHDPELLKWWAWKEATTAQPPSPAALTTSAAAPQTGMR